MEEQEYKNEIRKLKTIITKGEEQKKVLIAEIERRDNIIVKIKEYLGKENFLSILELVKE